MRPTGKRRGGYVMVLFAMLLFGLMAMAALVIDLGFARLAQLQMQSAADAAALEGLRNGDAAASDFVGLVFDDDLDTGEDSRQFGAGPIVTLTDNPNVGDPSLAASQDLSIPAARSYKPSMQSGSGAADGEYQVILQRGAPIDPSSTPNLFAQGPPVEFLFGRGSTLPRAVVRNGISVGAISLARREPVVCVGDAYSDPDPDPANNIPGKLDRAVPIGQWIAQSVTTFRAYTEHSIGGVATDASTRLTNQRGYLAIYDPAIGDRVIGFQAVLFDADGNVSPAPAFSVHNASAVFAFPLISQEDSDAALFESRETYRADLLRLPVSAGT